MCSRRRLASVSGFRSRDTEISPGKSPRCQSSEGRSELAAQEIEAEDYETLRELLEDGVDLNTASRDEIYSLPNLTYADADAILAYRQEAGSILDPFALVGAEVLSVAKFASIAPFLWLSEPDPPLFQTRGRLRYLTTLVAGDSEVPSMVLSGRVSTLKNLDVGVV